MIRSFVATVFVLLLSSALLLVACDGFSFVAMARRGRKGNLKRAVSGTEAPSKKKRKKSKEDPMNFLNDGRGQEITGVTLPGRGQLKGWEFGEGKRMACANVDGEFLAVQGDCPRCGFDLWKGDLIAADDPRSAGFEDIVPLVACPTCAVTYSLKTGMYGPPLKRKGLQGWVTGLAKTASANAETKTADAYGVSLEEETGRVFMKKRDPPNFFPAPIR